MKRARRTALKKKAPKGSLSSLTINGCSPMASNVFVATIFVDLDDAMDTPVSAETIVFWVVSLNLVLLVIRIRIVVLPSIVKLEEAHTRAVTSLGISAAFVSNDIDNLILTFF